MCQPMIVQLECEYLSSDLMIIWLLRLSYIDCNVDAVYIELVVFSCQSEMYCGYMYITVTSWHQGMADPFAR